ncbi:MAG: hypothetical protein J5768_07500 [Spirochaetales bacterium]|nr:hypothetical protein [Spirochaetales bacterium]
MKRVLLAICLLVVAMSLFAEVKGVVNFKPYFKFDNTPAADVETEGYYNNIGWKKSEGAQLDDWYMTKQDYWLEAFKDPSILDLGFVAQGDKFGVVFIMDIRQDTLIYFRDGNEGNFSNIPFLTHMIELNFPRMGYIDYRSSDGGFYASVGRRQIKWGPATYDMAIADSQPFLDNAYVQINIPMKNEWKFWYGFTGIAFKYFLNYGKYLDATYTADPEYKTWGPKTVFTHKFAMENQKLRFSFAELNVVYGKDPSLLDFSPTVVWHDNYQDDFSNVMLSFTAEGKFGPVRTFANFTMDDYDLPHENKGDQKFNSAKPAAIGVIAGVELNLLKGEEVKSSKFNYQDYALREDTFKVNTGLNIGYEIYYCSKFMYNRNHSVGKYASPYQFISFAGSGYCFDENAFFLGFKYGPDSLLNRLYVEYVDNPLSAYASVEYLRRGSYGIDSPYNKEYFNEHLETPYDLSEPVTDVLMLEAGCSYYLQEGFKVDASLAFTADITHGTQAFKANVGASIAVCDVDWNKLFK